MTKTIRNEKTRGWLDKLQQIRRNRKQARDLKADQAFLEFDSYFDDITPAM